MFRNRGEIPNITINTEENGGYRAPHYFNYWKVGFRRRFWIIKYDKTFVAMQLIATFLILLIVFAVYLFSYPISFEDPIATIKNNLLTAQLIAIGGSLLITGIVTFLTRSSKEKLIRNLRIVGLVSTVIMIALWMAKINMDATYNKDMFGKFYEQYEQTNNDDKSLNRISFGLSGVKLLNQKDAYIEESVNAYTNFSVKVMLYRIIHIAVILFLFYLSHRLSVKENKKERLAKDDAILYDEEENIKF